MNLKTIYEVTLDNYLSIRCIDGYDWFYVMGCWGVCDLAIIQEITKERALKFFTLYNLNIYDLNEENSTLSYGIKLDNGDLLEYCVKLRQWSRTSQLQETDYVTRYISNEEAWNLLNDRSPWIEFEKAVGKELPKD